MKKKLVILVLLFTIFIGCKSENDNDYVNKMNRSYQSVKEELLAREYEQINECKSNVIKKSTIEKECKLRLPGDDTSEVGGRSTENEVYALYASGVHEDNSASTNEFVWSKRQINASFPQIYFSNEFAEYDKEIETKINQALFDEGICHDSCFLINRDIRGLVEYDMDYVITKANEEIFSIKYQGHLYSVDHGQNICSGITIDVKTGEKISLSEFIALDDELLNQLQSGDIEYVDQAGYEKEMIIEIVRRFLDYYKKDLIDTDNCYYIEQDVIGLIVPVYQGNANYIILNIPIKQ